MKEFRVVWVQCPTIDYSMNILFVEAGDADDAQDLARDYIERKFGIGDYIKFEVTEAKLVPPGKVITGE